MGSSKRSAAAADAKAAKGSKSKQPKLGESLEKHPCVVFIRDAAELLSKELKDRCAKHLPKDPASQKNKVNLKNTFLH